MYYERDDLLGKGRGVQRESPSIEYKERVSSSFLKTVSAYANYGTGRIIFGVTDAGEVCGLGDPVAECLHIENMVNDCLDPLPRYRLEPMPNGMVELTVYEGAQKPYLAKGKAYRRGDSATIPVDRLEYGRLVLAGSNLSFDQVASSRQDLSFSMLEGRLRSQLEIDGIGLDVLKTLGLFSSADGYTNAAALLADENQFRGTDIMRFGESVNQMMGRSSLAGVSILSQLDGVLDQYEQHYVYETVEGAERRRVERLPREALREAMANALIHRAWDIEANIAVSLWPDRIEIVSPGSLPSGISEAEYLDGFVSVPRNPVIANVFFRLRYIEKFGTGIARIREAYAGEMRQPEFSVYPESIRVVLPVSDGLTVTADERAILKVLAHGLYSRSELETATGFGREKTIRVLNRLVAAGLVVKRGRARATRYTRS